MRDQGTSPEPSTDAGTSAPPEACDLCVIGAGIAGLNALFVAAEYLPAGARVVLLDRNPGPGGMWTGVYDFVRLHQPHGMFTAGDIPWTLGKPREYLATAEEVRAHLADCVDRIAASVDLVQSYGHEVFDTEEIDTPDGPRARIRYRAVGTDGPVRTLETPRLIAATAFNISPPAPLALSSGAVRTCIPETLTEEDDGTAPVVVVGGGKTGMDTILALLDRNPDRRITLINGKGTIFARRDLFFPTGPRGWITGIPLIRTFGDISMRFDGTNEDIAFEHFKKTYSISPDGTGGQFFFGLLSDAEARRVREGLAETIPDYLEDVTDTADGPVLRLRDGTTRPTEPGTLFVTCTGHVLREMPPDARLLSEKGTTLTITTRAAIHFLSSVSAYFLTHLFLRGTLRKAGLRTLDMDTLFSHGRTVWMISTVTLTYANTIALTRALPFKVLDRCGLDLDRWHPLPKRLLALIDIKINGPERRTHCLTALGRLEERFGIVCSRVT